MRTALIALSLTTLYGCATAPAVRPTEVQVGQSPVSVTTEEGAVTMGTRVSHDRYVSDDIVEGEPLELWMLLPNAYEAVGLPLPVVDRAKWSVTVRNHVAQRQIGGERMSNFLMCGSGHLGEAADRNRVRLSITTWIEPGDRPGRSVVRTTLDATSQDPMHATAGTTHCSTRGRLEMLVRAHLRHLIMLKRAGVSGEEGDDDVSNGEL